MRIVAGDAGEPGVALAPALTALEAVGLGLGVGYSSDPRKFYVPPGAVARTAEVHGVDRVKLGGVEDRGVSRRSGAGKLGGLHGGDVVSAGTMAGFAGHAWGQIFLVELIADAGSGGMAGEAPADFGGAHRAVHGFFEVFRRG